MDDRWRIGRRDLDRRMCFAGRRPADQERHVESFARHLLGHMHHFVQRRRNEPAQADDVRLLVAGRGQNLLTRHHHAQIDDLIVVAAEHDADDVLPDVVNVSLHGRENDPALRLVPAQPFAFLLP